MTHDEQLAETLSQFYDDPLGYVMFMFPWDTERSIQRVKLDEKYKDRFDSEYGPDIWACEFLDDLGEQIRLRGFDGQNAVDPIRYSTASGHGIGKSTLVAWLCKFIMDTRPLSKGTVTANTAEQLKTKTWAEVGKWHKLSLTEHWFKYSATRGSMSLVHVDHKEDWRLDAQTCREENSEAFAGQHAPAGTSFYIFDEASGIPKNIYTVREGGLTDGEPMVFDFGNPTRNSGDFYENSAGSRKHRYRVRTIDSRTVALTNKTLIQQWVDDYGEESDFVKVRVRGVFPSAGSSQFIGMADVEAAMAREVFMDRTAPLVIGVDVARFGDDESVIYPRIGMDARSFPPMRFRKLDTVQLTGKVIECVKKFRALGLECAGIFVDGGGIGGSVVDQLRSLGHNPFEVQFGGSPTDGQTYRYKSDEMWGTMRDAIATRLVLPSDLEGLKDQLTQREFGYTLVGDKIHLETKKDMKARGVDSPDLADALALTFAMEVAPRRVEESPAQTMLSDYDPFVLNF